MALDGWVVDHRVVPLETLKTAIDSKRFRSLTSRLATYLATPLPKHPQGSLAVKTVGEAAPAIILKEYSAVIAQGRKVLQKPKLKNFHKLRIQMKRLRYACEFVGPAYDDALDSFISRTVAIQDCLGELQDTVFTQAFIDRIVRDWKGKAVDPGLLFLLGEIYQLQGEIARARQAAFAGIWREFDRAEVLGELRSILSGATGGGADDATGGELTRKDTSSPARSA
jgi:CHAD domain-containing protein